MFNHTIYYQVTKASQSSQKVIGFLATSSYIDSHISKRVNMQKQEQTGTSGIPLWAPSGRQVSLFPSAFSKSRQDILACM